MTDPSDLQQPPPLPPELPTEPPLPPEPPVPQPREPFWGYSDLAFLIAAALVIGLAISLVAAVFFKPSFSAGAALAVTFTFEGLWFAALYGVMRFGYGRPFWRSLGWVNARRGIGEALVWGVLAALISVVISSLLPPVHVKTPMEDLIKGRASLLLLGFFAVTLGPLCEELAFRGFLQPLLVATFGAVGGVLLQAVPFAVLHGAEYAWSWQQLILMFVAGSAFGWMRHRTGSTAASTYMHAGFNLVVFAGMLLDSFVHKA